MNNRDIDDRSNTAAVAYFEGHADYYERTQYRTSRRTFINARHDQILSLLPVLPVPPGASALDAGCGPGNLIPQLARRFARVCAMDTSPRMLQIARANNASCGNVSYNLGSIEALPYGDESFDFVCSAGVIEYLPSYERAVAEMHRVLRPGGLLLLPTTNALAPAHWFRPVLEPVARLRPVARLFGIEPGSFRLWYHRVPDFKERLRASGFALERERHFYLTLPRPMDRLFPGVARNLETVMDRYMETPIRHLAEGYIAVARKIRPASPSAASAAPLHSVR